jgi:hypothetical protein
VVHNGTYYDLGFGSEVVSEEILYALRVENIGPTSVDGEVAYDELPEGDREALSRIFGEEGATEKGFEGGAEYPYPEDEYNRSELVDGPGASELIEVLRAVYDALSVPFDPESVGGVASAGGPDDPLQVARAVERALIALVDDGQAETVDAEVVSTPDID